MSTKVLGTTVVSPSVTSNFRAELIPHWLKTLNINVLFNAYIVAIFPWKHTTVSWGKDGHILQ